MVSGLRRTAYQCVVQVSDEDNEALTCTSLECRGTIWFTGVCGELSVTCCAREIRLNIDVEKVHKVRSLFIF